MNNEEWYFRIGPSEHFCALVRDFPNMVYPGHLNRRHRCFREGRTNIDGLRTSISTTDENVERFPEIVCADRPITIDAIASELGISHGSIHRILHNEKHSVCLHLIPKMLTPEQKEMRVNMSRWHSPLRSSTAHQREDHQPLYKLRVCSSTKIRTRLDNVVHEFAAVGNLVARASDSRPDGLGSMPDATKYPQSTQGVRAH
ncbi:uncharacterized protein TNCV_853291 [Trichonephila clavipes]|nr:uncharacterized protein TNCV_853291 [Trichonephila clavipes]